MTDKPTPTTDLLKRCAEIHEWRSTGVLSGEALRDYAKQKWPDRHDTLQMAEHETVTEALALLAKCGPPAGAGEPFGYFHQLLNHEGKGNGVWLGAAERKVVEQAHTPGETSEEIVALYTTPQPTHAQAMVEPLTPERVKEIVRGAGYDQCGIPDTERAAFINGLRHGEQAHGIKGGQHVS